MEVFRKREVVFGEILSSISQAFDPPHWVFFDGNH